MWGKASFKDKMVKLSFSVVSIIAILLLWQLVALWVSYTREVPFPTPLETFSRLICLLDLEPLYGLTIYRHLSDSLVRWSTGFVLAALIGIFLGVVIGYSHFLHEIFMPMIYVLQLIPGLAWIPIALLVFGLGETATVFMIFVVALTPIIINTAGGTRGIDKKYVRAAKMMGAKDTIIFFRIVLPGASLQILNGLRIGLGNGWRVLIAAEMIVGVASGIGYSIIQARWSLDFVAAFVCIVLICIIGLLIEKLIFGVAEKKMMERLGFESV